MLSHVEAVIFDMDGLLVDSERLANAALVRTARAYGIAATPALFIRMIGLPIDGSIDLLKSHFGPDFPAEQFVLDASIAGDAMADSGELLRKPGAAELTACLKLARIPMAVATSSDRRKAIRTLTQTHLIDRFDAILTRTDVLRGKPYPDLYLRAAEALNVPVSRCIAFEDSINGVRAASAAQMRVIMIPDLLSPTAEMELVAEAVLPDLFAAMDVLQAADLFPPHENRTIAGRTSQAQ